MSITRSMQTPHLKNSTNVHAISRKASPLLALAFRIVNAAAPEAAAKLAMRLCFTPRKMAIREDERLVLLQASRFTLFVNGQRVEGYSWGKGPAVLLVHGWGGHAGHMTAFVKPLTQAGLRPIALDMPAHGASEGKQSSLVHFARAIEEAQDIFGPFHALIGHSIGGAACVNALVKNITVRRAILIAPPATFDSIWAGFRQTAGVSDHIFTRMIKLAERWLKIRMDDAAPIRLARHIIIPVLILHAPDDAQIPFGEAAELAVTFGNGHFKAMPGLGHLRILKDWRTVLTTVEFLRGQPRLARAT